MPDITFLIGPYITRIYVVLSRKSVIGWKATTCVVRWDTCRKAVGMLPLARQICTSGITASVTVWNVFSALTVQPPARYLEVKSECNLQFSDGGKLPWCAIFAFVNLTTVFSTVIVSDCKVEFLICCITLVKLAMANYVGTMFLFININRFYVDDSNKVLYYYK